MERRSEAEGAMGGLAATVTPAGNGDIEAAIRELRFPLVLKPRNAPEFRHRFRAHLLRADGPEELRRTWDQIARYEPQVCEVIPGDDSLLWTYGSYRDASGRALARFTGRKLRQWPVGFGAARAAESRWDPDLADRCDALLDALGFHGISQLETKRDRRDGTYRLMEINPKFWGSLDLAIAAGVEFPWLAVQAALGEQVDESFPYPVGLRFRWTFEDLMHTVARPASLGAFLRDFSPRVRSDLVWSDPAPMLVGAAITTGNLVHRLVSGRLRTPHGRPRPPH